MSSQFGKDLTTGSIPRHLLAFSMPMLIGNLLNVGYGIINTIWVGRILGDDAVGATAVSFPIVFILIGLASGATMATTILVSQYYGAKNFDMVRKVVNTSFSLSILFGLFLTIAGIISSDFMLHQLGTPSEIFGYASSYLKINLAGFLLMYMSFLIPSILRGIGDTKTPLIFLALGVGINAVLDPLFILGLGPIPRLGLNGAAYASVIATGIAFISGLIYLNRKNHLVSFSPKNMSLDKGITVLIIKIGLPSAVQQTLVSLGFAVVTRFVNSFGASAIAAFGAAGRVDNIAFMPAMSLGMAVSALTGQNLGAGKPERVKEIFKWGVIMTSAITLIISLFAVIFPGVILSAFNLKPDVMEIGKEYLRIVGSSYILFAIMFVANGVINGAGHTITTMLFSLLALWVVRIPMAAILSKPLGTKGIWLSMAISFGVVMAISLIYYFSGKWKQAVIRNFTPAPMTEIE